MKVFWIEWRAALRLAPEKPKMGFLPLIAGSLLLAHKSRHPFHRRIGSLIKASILIIYCS
jgi:hypothetical protein